MEASKFGFEVTPPAFKFDPTDADIAVYYLLPRALGLRNPHAHAIVDEDPGIDPPWKILERNGHVANSDHVVHAFFFGPPADASKNGGRKCRTVPSGGVWQGQKGTEETVTIVSPDGASELDIRFKKYNLTFSRGKDKRSTGYVMHEYELLEPHFPGAVLTRIKAQKNAYRPPPVPPAVGADQQQQQLAVLQLPEQQQPGPSYEQQEALLQLPEQQQQQPGPSYEQQEALLQLPEQQQQQPGPSYEYDATAANGEGFAGAQDGARYDGNDYYYTPLGCALPELQYYDDNYSAWVQGQQPVTSYNYNEGFTGAQADACYGGGMVDTSGGAYYDASNEGFTAAQAGAFHGGAMMDTSGAGYDPSYCVPQYDGEYTDYNGECQQWQYQQDLMSSQYQQQDLMISSQCQQQDPMSNQCQQQDPMSNQCQQQDPMSSQCQQQDPMRNQCQQQGPMISNQHQAEDAAVMCTAGEEGLTSEQVNGALPGNSDNGVVGTDTTHSTISLCDGGEDVCDDATFYKVLFGEEDKREQNDAVDPATDE